MPDSDLAAHWQVPGNRLPSARGIPPDSCNLQACCSEQSRFPDTGYCDPQASGSTDTGSSR